MLDASWASHGERSFRIAFRSLSHTFDILTGDVDVMNFELMSVDNDCFRWALHLKLDFHCTMIAKGTLQFQLVQRDVVVDWFNAEL